MLIAGTTTHINAPSTIMNDAIPRETPRRTIHCRNGQVAMTRIVPNRIAVTKGSNTCATPKSNPPKSRTTTSRSINRLVSRKLSRDKSSSRFDDVNIAKSIGIAACESAALAVEVNAGSLGSAVREFRCPRAGGNRATRDITQAIVCKRRLEGSVDIRQ